VAQSEGKGGGKIYQPAAGHDTRTKGEFREVVTKLRRDDPSQKGPGEAVTRLARDDPAGGVTRLARDDPTANKGGDVVTRLVRDDPANAKKKGGVERPSKGISRGMVVAAD